MTPKYLKPKFAIPFWQRQRNKVGFKLIGHKGSLRNIVRSHSGHGMVPSKLIEALQRIKLRALTTENRAVGFVAAQRHFTRPFWRNYFGRAEMKAIRATTGTKRATTAAALVISKSRTGGVDKLRRLSHQIKAGSGTPMVIGARKLSFPS